MNPNSEHQPPPPNPSLLNAHLEGEPFFWEAGPVGVWLSHGFTATTAEVRPLACYLHALNYSIAGPLLPGHGSNPDDLNHARWQDWVNEAEVSYQRLNTTCQAVVVGGESTGALLALYLAAHHPEIKAVLAYAPALRLILSSWNRLLIYLLAPWVRGVPKKQLDADTDWQGYRINPLKGTIQLLEFQSQVKRCLPRVHAPVLVIQGRLDTVVHPYVPSLLVAGLASQDIEIHWMEQSSHVIILQKERQHIFEITRAFLSKVIAV